mmetsp:Transcript_13661/g.38470  ORF Transcript_13661/g.38470 Transcript_13661/m.38470 type:complete len:205 (-) Transcript_13661:1345-1959(-)
MVQGLVVVLLIDLSPDFVHLLLDVPPFLVLLFQPLVHDWDCISWNSPEKVKNGLAMLRIDLLDAANVNWAQQILRQSHSLLCVVRKRRNLLRKLIQHLDGCGVAFNAHFKLKSIILAPEQGFLVLVSSQALKAKGVLRSCWKRDPLIVQHASKHGLQLRALVLIPAMERHLGVVRRELAVRRSALLTHCEIKVRYWPCVVLLPH